MVPPLPGSLPQPLPCAEEAAPRPLNMPVVTSQYWNIVYGREPGQAALDTEGLQTMRTLANNMAALLKATDGKPLPPREEPWEPMHFIR